MSSLPEIKDFPKLEVVFSYEENVKTGIFRLKQDQNLLIMRYLSSLSSL
jgi:hypothetical protein